MARHIASKIIAEQSLTSITDDEIFQLLGQGTELFNSEPARVVVQAPCYVFGDIHGNLPYFLKFFTIFVGQRILRLEPPMANVLLLGDFVDRGASSLEITLLLVSWKLLFPDKIFVVRGNHEIHEINIRYGFRDEVLEKRTDNGEAIYEACNKLFTKLPLVATLRDFVCMHGGLPRPERWDFMMGDNFHKPADDGQIHSSFADWAFADILWSDFSHNSNKLRLYKDKEPDKNMEGEFGDYRFNQKCQIAIEANDIFVKNFLAKFHRARGIIRGHEPQPMGFKINDAGTVLTLHSSVKYASDSDRGSIAFVPSDPNSKIKILTLKPKNGGKQKAEEKTNEGNDEIGEDIATVD